MPSSELVFHLLPPSTVSVVVVPKSSPDYLRSPGMGVPLVLRGGQSLHSVVAYVVFCSGTGG